MAQTLHAEEVAKLKDELKTLNAVVTRLESQREAEVATRRTLTTRFSIVVGVGSTRSTISLVATL